MYRSASPTYTGASDSACRLASELSKRGLNVIALDFTAHMELGRFGGIVGAPAEESDKELKTRKKSKAGMAEM